MNNGIVVYLLCLVAFVIAGEDFYKLLGVNRDSTKKQISSAFRKLALRYHPDKNTNNPKEAEEKFIEISKAYEVLADKDKRLIYDQYGEEGLKDNGFSQKYSSTNMHDFFSNFDKMFKNQGGGDSQNFFSGNSNFDTFFEDFETMENGEENGGILNSLFDAGSTMFGMKKKVKHMKNAIFEEGNIEDVLGDMGGFGFGGGFGGMKCKTIKIVRNGMSSSKTVCS